MPPNFAFGLFEHAAKATISGVAVAAIAAFVLSKAETAIERSEQRSALKQLQNLTIIGFTNGLATRFVELDCLREASLPFGTTCRNSVRDLTAYIDKQSQTLVALVPDMKIDQVSLLEASLHETLKIPDGHSLQRDQIQNLSRLFQSSIYESSRQIR
jgi:hypothetical protein